jgi:metal-responsive CopG/Arc/MetJ family transcriptional regulator
MKANKKEEPYMLRVLMSGKERQELESICEMNHANRSEVVRMALRHYYPIAERDYKRRMQAVGVAQRVEQAAEVATIY